MVRGGCRKCGSRTTNNRLCNDCQRLQDRGFFATANERRDDDHDDELEYRCVECGHEQVGTISDDCEECGARRWQYIGPLPGEDQDEDQDQEAIADGGETTCGKRSCERTDTVSYGSAQVRVRCGRHALEAVDGIGPTSAERLYDEFGSLEEVCYASRYRRAAIANLRGFSPDSASDLEGKLKDAGIWQPSADESEAEAETNGAADGGTGTESELVDRAVREVVDLVEAGDSRPVAVDYVCNQHELSHRRDDIDERVRERLDQTVATDGGVDQSSSGVDGEVLAGRVEIKVREDRVKLSYTIGGVVGGCWGETVEEAFQNFIQHHGNEDLRPNPDEGRYVLPNEDFPKCPNCGELSSADHHEWVGERIVGCDVDPDTEPVTDGGRDPEELVVATCDPCDYRTVVAVGTLPMTSCPDCQDDLEIDDDLVAHKCPDATGFNHVTVERGEHCPFCQIVQGQPVATDGGVDIDPEAAREEMSFFIRGSNARGADAALHLPTEDATRDDLSVRCKYNQRTGVSWHVQEADATPDWQLEKRGCSECFGTATRAPDDQYGRKPSDVLEEAGFDTDLVTDGGRDRDCGAEPDPEGREAFLAGEAHWCDICSTPFDSLAELGQHDCVDVDADGDTDEAVTDGGHEFGSIESRLAEIDTQAGIVLEDLDQEGLDPTARAAVEGYLGTIQFYIKAIECLLEDGAPSDDDDDEGGTPIAIADGGREEHRATCEDCPWSYADEDLVDVSDEMERHARKEMHDVDLERAVATDGGVQSPSGTERKVCADCTDPIEGDDELIGALQHYLESHPHSDRLQSIVDEVYISWRCGECNEPFIADLRVSTDDDGEGCLTVPNYCSRCELSDPLLGVLAADVSPSDAVTRQFCHETDSYRLDKTKVSPEWTDVYITCPECDYATTVDLPRGKCDHCGTTISLLVQSRNHSLQTGTDHPAPDSENSTRSGGGDR